MYSENTKSKRKTKKMIFIIGLALTLLITAGCDMKAPAIGETNQIVVLADNEVWNRAGFALKEVYEREIFTPQIEKTFIVTRPPIGSSSLYEKFHNLILLGTLDSDGIIGEVLNNSLTPENRASVESGEKYAFQQRNLWARNQYMLIIVAPTINDLIDKLKANSDWLYNLIDNTVNTMVKQQMYERLEQVEKSKQIYDAFDFTLRIQHDYILKEYPERNALILRRYVPDRIMTIHWVDTTDVTYISDEWILSKRREIAESLFAGRMVIENSLITKRVTLSDFNAVEKRGLWYHPEEFYGGPMVNYTFFDETTSRIYMIDLAVYAPYLVGDKAQFLRQLSVMAGTFTTNPRNVLH